SGGQHRSSTEAAEAIVHPEDKDSEDDQESYPAHPAGVSPAGEVQPSDERANSGRNQECDHGASKKHHGDDEHCAQDAVSYHPGLIGDDRVAKIEQEQAARQHKNAADEGGFFHGVSVD